MMPLTNKELNAIALKAWRPSPQSEFLKELMAKAALKPLLAHVAPNGNFNVPVEKPISPQSEFGATAVARVTRVEDGQVTEITVTGSGSFADPYVLRRKEPDILSITRDVVRGG